MTGFLPKVQHPITDARGVVSREWYSFFRSLTGLGGEQLQAELTRLADRVTALEDGESFTFVGAGSIVISNVGGVITVALQGDNESPGGNWYYGTNADGIRGFWPIADGVGATHSIVKAVDYGAYDFQGELDVPEDLPYPVVVGDAYLINGDLWVGADDGGDDGPGWDNIGPAPTTAVLELENDEATPDPAHYYGTDESGVRGYHERRLDTLADVTAPAPTSGQVLTYTGSEWAPATNLATGVFNYISADGDIYVTEDGADLYIGV